MANALPTAASQPQHVINAPHTHTIAAGTAHWADDNTREAGVQLEIGKQSRCRPAGWLTCTPRRPRAETLPAAGLRDHPRSRTAPLPSCCPRNCHTPVARSQMPTSRTSRLAGPHAAIVSKSHCESAVIYCSDAAQSACDSLLMSGCRCPRRQGGTSGSFDSSSPCPIFGTSAFKSVGSPT